MDKLRRQGALFSQDSSSQPFPPNEIRDFALGRFLNDRDDDPIARIILSGPLDPSPSEIRFNERRKQFDRVDSLFREVESGRRSLFRHSEESSSSSDVPSLITSTGYEDNPSSRPPGLIDYSGGREYRGPRPPTPEPRPSRQSGQRHNNQEINPRCPRGHEVGDLVLILAVLLFLQEPI